MKHRMNVSNEELLMNELHLGLTRVCWVVAVIRPDHTMTSVLDLKGV